MGDAESPHCLYILISLVCILLVRNTLLLERYFYGESPLEIYYQFGIEEVMDRKDLFDQAVHVMKILLFYAENGHLPLTGIKHCSAEKGILYGCELIKFRFRHTTEYSPEAQEQMKPLIKAGVRELRDFYSKNLDQVRLAGHPHQHI